MDAVQPVSSVKYRVSGLRTGSLTTRGVGRDMTRYEIKVHGCLDCGWSQWFNGMDIRNVPGGDAVLCGEVIDQAALHGLLIKIRDLGLPLISVRTVQSYRDGKG
jgi:hypothetical protein